MKHVLIVDNDPIMLSTFSGLLKSQGGFINVLTADSVQAAFELIAGQPIHLVLTGLHLPVIGGFELIVKIARRYPDTRIILLNNNLAPMMRTKFKQIPNAIYFDQSMDVGLLNKRIFTELGIDYGGQLRGISLPSFLQMLELEGRSCTLLVRAKSASGYLYMSRGNCIAADCDGLSAREAALEMLTWENVTIDIDFAPPDVDRTIDKPLMGLIMESGRMIDDTARERADQRRHDRHECQVAIDFDVSNWTYQCCLRDISQGGAYVETEQKIETGQKVLLTLASPGRNGQCVVNGTVARRDANGLAIAFEELSLHQKKIVQTLISQSNPSEEAGGQEMN